MQLRISRWMPVIVSKWSYFDASKRLVFWEFEIPFIRAVPFIATRRNKIMKKWGEKKDEIHSHFSSLVISLVWSRVNVNPCILFALPLGCWELRTKKKWSSFGRHPFWQLGRILASNPFASCSSALLLLSFWFFFFVVSAERGYPIDRRD